MKIKITESLKKKAIETATLYDTRERPAKFSYHGKWYAVQQDGNHYTIFDDADGGNSLYFVEIGEFDA